MFPTSLKRWLKNMKSSVSVKLRRVNNLVEDHSKVEMVATTVEKMVTNRVIVPLDPVVEAEEVEEVVEAAEDQHVSIAEMVDIFLAIVRNLDELDSNFCVIYVLKVSFKHVE